MAAFALLQQRLMALHAPEFTTLDITMAQAKLLYVLMAAGELSLSQTAAQLGVAISTASGAVDHLVDLGLVDRSEDPANRRQIRVSVSATGREVLEQMREFSTRQFMELAAQLGDDELAVIERATTILARAAQSDPATQSETAAAPLHPNLENDPRSPA
jgi:DNA-binding MarR family transcriptional regulator